jgi:hypoxia up-regulated 1
LGIDFGSEFFKASLISPGKTFEIVENETSKRKTNNAVFLFN